MDQGGLHLALAVNRSARELGPDRTADTSALVVGRIKSRLTVGLGGLLLILAVALIGSGTSVQAQAVHHAFSSSTQYLRGQVANAVAVAYADWRLHVAVQPKEFSRQTIAVEVGPRTIMVTIFQTPGTGGGRTAAFQRRGTETVYAISATGSIVSRRYR